MRWFRSYRSDYLRGRAAAHKPGAPATGREQATVLALALRACLSRRWRAGLVSNRLAARIASRKTRSAPRGQRSREADRFPACADVSVRESTWPADNRQLRDLQATRGNQFRCRFQHAVQVRGEFRAFLGGRFLGPRLLVSRLLGAGLLGSLLALGRRALLAFLAWDGLL